MSLHFSEVIQLAATGIPRSALDINDRAYSVPTVSWVRDTLSPILFRDKPQPSENRWDCDNFAFNAYNRACELHRESTKKLTGITFGILRYVPEQQISGVVYRLGLQNHVINWYLAGEPGDPQPRLYYYEPQRPTEIPLTPMEIGSILWAYM